MIVRCTNCRTAFSVNDSKVRNKKFSFNCPKCAIENIFDNREEVEIPAVDSISTGVAADFSDDTFTATAGSDKPVKEHKGAEEDAIFTEEESLDIPSVEEPLDLLAETESREESNPPKESRKAAENKEDDFSLDDIETNINLDDIDIDLGSDEKAGKGEARTVEESDLILDDFEGEGKSGGDLVLDELSNEVGAGEKGESDIDDLNIDDILIPDDEPSTAPRESKDKGEILDLEQDLIALDEVELEKGDDEHRRDEDLALDFSDDDMIIKEEAPAKKAPAEEDVALDLDTLDIELDGDEDLLREVRRGSGKETVSERPAAEIKEDDLTLDLDSLDIELAESETIMEGEQPDDLDLLEEPVAPGKTTSARQESKETDENLTLDLDSLDITLEETDEILEGEIPDEDEKLTLQDAGLTIEELTTDENAAVLEGHEAEEEDDIKLTLEEIDPSLSGDLNELTTDEIASTVESEEEEDIKLSIDEIDPSLSVDEMGGDMVVDEVPEEKSRGRRDKESLLIEEINELPEIDLDDELSIEPAPVLSAGVAAAESGKRRNRSVYEEEMIDIDLGEEEAALPGLKKKKDLSDAAVKGSVSLSIDYSIKYSRLGAVARLLGLFGIIMIPHFIVFLLYTVLSSILGFLNHLIILMRRDGVEDFTQIIENTVRYFIAIYSSMIGVVEIMPLFAGRDSIDHPMQMKVIYPLHNSRWMAVLRLSMVGVLIALFPHLLIAAILSFGIPLLFFVGIVAVIVTGKWPSVLFDFFTRYYRYCARILCFGTGIVDEYPSFRFD